MNLFIQINFEKDLDVINFSPVQNAVTAPRELWFDILCASLRMKHNVLILEAPLDSLPLWNQNKLWDMSDHFCWLASRSLSTISSLYQNSAPNYRDFKTSLKTFN